MASTLSPAERSLRSRLAAHSLHAKGGTNTGPAKAAYDARWARLVDPDGSLSPGERERRAEHAKKAHYTAMALKSRQGASAARRVTTRTPAGQVARLNRYLERRRRALRGTVGVRGHPRGP